MQPAFVVVLLTLLLLGPLEATVDCGDRRHRPRARRSAASAPCGPHAWRRRDGRDRQCLPRGRRTRRWAARSARSSGRNRGCPSGPRWPPTAWSAARSAGLLTPLLGTSGSAGGGRRGWFARLRPTPWRRAVDCPCRGRAHQYWAGDPGGGHAAVVVYCGYHGSLTRFEDAYRRREVAENLVQGMAVVDGDGTITLWNDALERLLGCSRRRAIGKDLVVAIPGLIRTELPRTVGAVLGDRTPRTIARVDASGRHGRACRRDPHHPGGRRRHAALARHHGPGARRGVPQAQRTAAGAGRRRRQRRMVGVGPADPAVLLLGPLAGDGRPAGSRPAPAARRTGLERVHREDAASLKDRARGDPVGHRRRTFRTSTGSATRTARYRWFLCRGVAARGAGDRAVRIAGSLTDSTAKARSRRSG